MIYGAFNYFLQKAIYHALVVKYSESINYFIFLITAYKKGLQKCSLF